ncbi:ABC transporter substrate-binding protein [Limnohabitans sp. MMS-10A-160]|uniref:Bug family tripartite tricarboxylate transporter substrate binding protein n=1 Tax=unclassified Limnohabitans TaxID=2626134 RepID=UPI000DD2A11E|nr:MULTISPECIES: tripartite tricarboxylate transporter substrate binding protein [unclassified Limnohabitans]PUE18188.1 ABC transporter substrate-binding protein [Limnohabitans sp. MMS-10A-192]PUE27415.1 ABC transporter substrate-binding protein [Limnohabitans sp. MMS-10A-160]
MIDRRCLIQLGAAALGAPWAAYAQDKYPSKPITWVCPYAAGGNADNRSRQVAKVMGALMGQSIVIDNKAGAGGNIGTEVIAKARPDGYTVGMGNFAPLAVNHALFKKLNYNPFTDLVPIFLIEKGPLILMVRSDSPYKSVKDIVAAAKAAPGKLSYASGGIGGTHHLSGALFEHAAGIDMIHAPYKSGSAGATDLMGGQVHMMFEQMYSAMPAIKGGKLRALAITSKTRSPLAPDIPTMAEQGYPEVEVLNWQGLIGPKGMPADVIKQLNAIGNKALQDPDLKEKILSQGNEVGGGTPEQFAALIKAEAPRWAKVVLDAKIEPE